MPSPVGHALGGIAAGWLFKPAVGRAAGRPADRGATLAFAVLGMAADLDLLVGVHRGPSHSVGVTLIVGLVCWIALRRRGEGRLALACAAAYGSHVLLDWFGSDTSPPIGLQALWPWSSTYYQGPLPVFLAVSRRFHQPGLFWLPNTLALARELVILAPIVGLVYYLRRNRPQARRAAATVAAVIATGAVLVGTSRSLAAAPAQLKGEYSDLSTTYVRGVRLYLAGAFEDALTIVAAMTDADFAEQSAQLKNDPRMLQAAAMIHTELAFRPGTDVEAQAAAVHLTRARRFVRELRRVQTPGAFERGWVLLVSAELQAEKAVDAADSVLEEGRGIFPRDPDILLASGAASELRTFTTGRLLQVGRLPAGRQFMMPDPAREAKAALQTSAHFLSEAIALAPAQDEARLRLGRVLHRLGQVDQAAGELDVVRRRAVDPGLKYLAALFEAAVEMARNRPERAAELDLEALKVVPGQAAWIGLSAAYYDQGRSEAAAGALQAMYRPSQEADPWFAYLAGDGWHAAARRTGMRALVTGR